jgi:hypothetical protein
MARGRMISKSLSTSEKYAALLPVAGDLAEFCQTLYPLLVIHSDDFGRLQGDPFTVKSLCYPASRRSLEEFATALDQLTRIGLIAWYPVFGKKYIQIKNFENHQLGLHKRTRSTFPEIPGISRNFREIPGQEKRTKGKRREGKYPPTPLSAKGGLRLTRRDLTEAEAIRSRVHGGCPHDPHCHKFDACVRLIASERKAQAS